MIESSLRKRPYAALALLPCLVLYAVLFTILFLSPKGIGATGLKLGEKRYFDPTSNLPQSIAKIDIDRRCLSRLKGEELDLFLSLYMDEGDFYRINGAYSEASFEDMIKSIPEIKTEGKITVAEADALISGIKQSGLTRKLDDVDDLIEAFVAKYSLPFNSDLAVRSGANGLYALSGLKLVLASKWIDEGFNLGLLLGILPLALAVGLAVAFLLSLFGLAREASGGKSILSSSLRVPVAAILAVVGIVWKQVATVFVPALSGFTHAFYNPGLSPWLVLALALVQGIAFTLIAFPCGLRSIPASLGGAGNSSTLRGTVTFAVLSIALAATAFLGISLVFMGLDALTQTVGRAHDAVGTIVIVFAACLAFAPVGASGKGQ
ncbi:MAG TPA: hypothetical protein PKO22_07190 [Treponemataceae bacterium]|nr:hypothetical protein [Treponemataceae bacterium]